MASNTTLEDIAAVIGFHATLKLVAWAGDRVVYIPGEASETHFLARLLGLSAMRRMCETWGSSLLAVPTINCYDHDVLKHRVNRLLVCGMSTLEASRFLGVSRRRIEQVRAELIEQGLLCPMPDENSREKRPGKAGGGRGVGEGEQG